MAPASVRTGRALFALLVALTALAGWTVSLTHTSVVRAGSTVSGAVAKQAGPVATRAGRGAVTTPVVKAQRAGSAVRAAAQDSSPAVPLAFLAAIVVVAGLALRGLLTAARATTLRSAATTSPRGRAPPTGLTAPA